MIQEEFGQAFLRAAATPDPGDLARAALLIARIGHPRLDPNPYLAELQRMGEEAAVRLCRRPDAGPAAQVATLSAYLYDERGFDGDRSTYDDPRNSCLNDVLDRRAGIPITLAVVYIEVARRAGLQVDGVNFPGHFLLRSGGDERGFLIDPFDRGTILTANACRDLFYEHVGQDVAFDARQLAVCSKRQILIRILANLKNAYVRLHAYSQARDASTLMVALDPPALTELRDRGLLSLQLNDHGVALRDLETFLHLTAPGETGKDEKRERDELWEHVKLLRRRIANLN